MVGVRNYKEVEGREWGSLDDIGRLKVSFTGGGKYFEKPWEFDTLYDD